MPNTLKKDVQDRMGIAYDVFVKELAGLRTGRACPSFLDPVLVEAYGTPTPLSQLSNISVADARLLIVQVWDQALVRVVEKAIRESQLGLNPATEGGLIRVPLPGLTQERRLELAKVANKYAEGARVSVRGVRRDGMDTIKKLEKEKTLSADAARRLGELIQETTDIFIKKIDTFLALKEKEILGLDKTI